MPFSSNFLSKLSNILKTEKNHRRLIEVCNLILGFTKQLTCKNCFKNSVYTSLFLYFLYCLSDYLALPIQFTMVCSRPPTLMTHKRLSRPKLFSVRWRDFLTCPLNLKRIKPTYKRKTSLLFVKRCDCFKQCLIK